MWLLFFVALPDDFWGLQQNLKTLVDYVMEQHGDEVRAIDNESFKAVVRKHEQVEDANGRMQDPESAV